MTATDAETPSILEVGFDKMMGMLEGEPLNSGLDIPREKREALYKVGYTFYKQARYADAMRVFTLLMTVNHLDARYFTGLAACLQMQDRHADALKYHGAASMLDLTDSGPPLHSAECYLALGDHANARMSLNYALAQARGRKGRKHYIPRIEAMLAFLDDAAGSSTGSPEKSEKSDAN